MSAGRCFAVFACWLLLAAGNAAAAVGAAVPISAQLGTSIAASLFPVTLPLTHGKLFLTEPALLYMNNGRIGLQARFQAYDHRPAQGIAVSETGKAVLSARLGFDPATRQILLHDPHMDTLEFDRNSEVTGRLREEIRSAWSAQVTDPFRADIPPHPYLLPFRNNIQNLSYDGQAIVATIAYQ